MRKYDLTVWWVRIVMLAVLLSMVYIGNGMAAPLHGHDLPAPVCDLLQADEPDIVRPAPGAVAVASLAQPPVIPSPADITVRHLSPVLVQPPEAASRANAAAR
jgi:hypothetical protein